MLSELLQIRVIYSRLDQIKLDVEVNCMITLSADEVALLKAILTALRGIKVRDIDKALMVLSKAERQP